ARYPPDLHSFPTRRSSDLLAQEGREDEARRRTLEREAEWVRSSPKARQAKSKARYERYEELLKVANAKVNAVAQIVIPVAERLRSEEHTSELQSRENLVCR